MSVNLYKPNSYNTGCAFSFEFGEDKNKTPTFYVKSIHQHHWNVNTKTGSFSENSKKENGKFIFPQHNIAIKLNEFELGGLLKSMSENTLWQGYHSSSASSDKTQIFFEPKIKKSKIKTKDSYQEVDVNGFVLTLLRNGADKFSVFIEPGESEVIKEFIRYFLRELFEHRQKNKFSNNKKQEEYKENSIDNF